MNKYNKVTLVDILILVVILAAIITPGVRNAAQVRAGEEPDLAINDMSYSRQARVRYITDQPDRQIVPRVALEITENPPVLNLAESKTDYEWFRHPAFGREPGGTLLRGYEHYLNNDTPQPIAWQYSTDNGLNWSEPCYFLLYGFLIDGQFPSVDYFGDGTRLFGTHVVTNSFFMGGGVVVYEFGSPSNTETWTGWWSDFSDNGFHDMQMCEIACDSGQQSWNWGLVSIIIDGIIPYASTDCPAIYSQIDFIGHTQISWYPNFPGCLTTAADIDPLTSRTYAVYDRLDTDTDQWQLFIRKDNMADWFQTTVAASIYYENTQLHLKYPAVAAYGDTIVIVAHSYDASTPENVDLVCWGVSNGNLAEISFRSTVAGQIDAEEFPELSHLGGDKYVCTFIRDGQLCASVTADGGLSWSSPHRVSSGAEPVIDQYRAADICDGGLAVMWSYHSGDNIWLNMADLDCLDGDSDGICDEEDNCPTQPNPGQDDGDSDGIGDLCDNCPADDNPDQFDADLDGAGDTCDDCTDTDGDGYGNPGFAANTCPPDNCPGCFNPDQADSNSDGIGDACDTYLCGDANGDTNINVGDAVYVVNYVFHDGPEPSPLIAGDANDDSRVNIGDAVYLVNHVFHNGPEPCLK